MTADMLRAIGGLGLFLVGMQMLSGGLQSLAADRLRQILRGSTSSTVRGAVAGAVVTAMVQSSSATTVATVGFVSAGLMTFQHSLGIIFGANLGSTVTGWLVAVFGFKLEIGTVLMPAILAGVLANMFAKSQLKWAGWAIAGLGVLFVGIDLLKGGMVMFGDVLSPERFPGDTVAGRFQLVILGVVVTVVTQSSGAGVASALAALLVGAISFSQAAALVIGMNVGTTFTAIFATIGGSTAAKRTGVAHLVYNVLTGTVAFAFLSPLGWLVEGKLIGSGLINPEIALVAFHTAFNGLVLVAMLFATPAFARLIIRLLPERGSDLARRLDDRLLVDPKAALDASFATVRDIADYLYGKLADRLSGRTGHVAAATDDRLTAATNAARDFVEAVRADPATDDQDSQRDLLHALDHLDRLHHRLTQANRLDASRRFTLLRDRGEDLVAVLGGSDRTRRAGQMVDTLEQFHSGYRDELIRQAASHEVDPDTLTLRLDASRWLHRTAYHVWRIGVHLDRVAGTHLGQESPADTEPTQ